MPYDNLLLDRPAEGIALVTLNRPESLNAITEELHAELDAAADRVGGE